MDIRKEWETANVTNDLQMPLRTLQMLPNALPVSPMAYKCLRKLTANDSMHRNIRWNLGDAS